MVGRAYILALPFLHQRSLHKNHHWFCQYLNRAPLTHQMNSTQAKWITVAAAIFISGLIFLFLPSEIYLRNPLEFISTPTQLITTLALGGLLLSICLVLPVLVPVARWKKAYAMLLGGLGVALWVSSVFLVADLGELDGASFDLTRHTEILTYHTGWFALVLLAACIGMWKRPMLVVGSMAVIGFGLALIMVSNFYQVSQNKERNFIKDLKTMLYIIEW